MRKNMKIRMAVFLCVIMVLPSILSILPMTATEVSAADDVLLYWNYDIIQSGGKSIQVEKGQKFNIGDYAYISDGNTYGCASLFSKARYSSSKKSVATVDSKGNFKAKKTGTTTITIKYKGKKISYKFRIVKAGTFGTSKAIKNLRQASEKLSKNMPKTITTSNGYKYLKMSNEFSKNVAGSDSDVKSSGFLTQKTTSGTMSFYTVSNKLAVPQAGRAEYLKYMLYQYGNKNCITSTRGSKTMKIESVSATTKQITIKGKEKVGAAGILAANIMYPSYNTKISQKTAAIYMYVYDETDKKYYTGIGTITKGSNIVRVKLREYTYSDGEYTYVSKKLKKGHTYVLGNEQSWEKGRKVKVK